MFFEVLGLLERYHPRRQLRMQLARIMVLNLLNLYALIFALFVKISAMSKESECIKKKATNWLNASTTTATPFHLYSGGDKILLNTTDGYGTYTTDAYTESYLSSTMSDMTTIVAENTTRCWRIIVSCVSSTTIPSPRTTTINQTLLTSMLLLNLSTTMPPEYTTNLPASTFPNYDDPLGSTNFPDEFSNDYTPTDSSTESMNVTFDRMGNDTDDFDTNATMVDVTNGTLRFKRQSDYYDYGTDEFDESYNDYSNLQDETTVTTTLYENVTDTYATVSTIPDNITSTSWTDENTVDYARKCWLDVGMLFLVFLLLFLISVFFSSL